MIRRKTIKSQGRVEFIDFAKGIWILLVIGLHTGAMPDSLAWLGMIRMPLYFVLSGLFFKDYGNFRGSVVRKVNKLLIPFVFFTLPMGLISILWKTIFMGISR